MSVASGRGRTYSWLLNVSPGRLIGCIVTIRKQKQFRSKKKDLLRTLSSLRLIQVNALKFWNGKFLFRAFRGRNILCTTCIDGRRDQACITKYLCLTLAKNHCEYFEHARRIWVVGELCSANRDKLTAYSRRRAPKIAKNSFRLRRPDKIKSTNKMLFRAPMHFKGLLKGRVRPRYTVNV